MRPWLCKKNVPKLSLTFLESDVSHKNSSSLHIYTDNIPIVYLYGGITLPKSKIIALSSNNYNNDLLYCKSVWNLPHSVIQMLSLCSFCHHNRQGNIPHLSNSVISPMLKKQLSLKILTTNHAVNLQESLMA